MKTAAQAVEQDCGMAPVFIREGGSIPIVAVFQRELNADPVLLGGGQDDDNLHAPNEWLGLEDFHKAIRVSAFLWEVQGEG